MLPNDLEPAEVRVLGSLIEKECTTPDHYPLSLNALTAACNQSSNRDPVMSLDEETVSHATDMLRRRGLVRSIQPIGSRVQKFQHLLGESLEFTRAELAVISVLALRGHQTQAEVRSRGARLMPGDDSTGLDEALEGLANREPDPVVVRLARQPGQKEPRYAHRLSGDVSPVQPAETLPVAPVSPVAERIGALEDAVQELRKEVTDLQSQLASFRRQFE